MNWFTGIVLYFLIWWIALFAVLPIGAQPEAEADDATGWRGAPRKPRIFKIVIVTTIVTAILWLIAFAVIESDFLSFRHGILAGD